MKMMCFRIIKIGLLSLIFLFLLAPALINIVSAFTEAAVLTWPPKGFSFKWFLNFLGSPIFTRALIVSIELAVISSIISLLMGFGAAYAIDRYDFWGKSFLETFLTSPLMIPLIIIGIAVLQFWSALGLRLSLWSLVVGHVIICMPYVTKTMLASFLLYDRTMEEAAQTLGARPYKVLLRITLPILKSGILASSVFAFIYSFNNLSVSIFLSGVRQATLPVVLFAMVEASADPTLFAISTVVIISTFAVVFLVQKVAGFERFM